MMNMRLSACAVAAPNSTAATAPTAIKDRIGSPNPAHRRPRQRAASRQRPQECGGGVKLSLSDTIQTGVAAALGAAQSLRGFWDLDAMHLLDHCAGHDVSRSHLRHLPGDYSLAPNAGCGRLFSPSRLWTRPASRPEVYCSIPHI